jgi:cytidylate kinase
MTAATRRSVVITIDGPAGSGKSTTARRVADALGIVYLDSGALYRAVTWAALDRKIDLSDEQLVTDLAERLDIVLRATANGLQVLVDGADVSAAIRTPQVTEAIAPVAGYAGVRSALLQTQRTMALQGSLVAEGRDMGSVVFPDADLKFFMVASIEERARRRQAELAGKGIELDMATLIAMIGQRDQSDAGREHAPLLKPAGAIEIDTSSLSVDEQVQLVVEQARRLLMS